jgi:hypothetical protein
MAERTLPGSISVVVCAGGMTNGPDIREAFLSLGWADLLAVDSSGVWPSWRETHRWIGRQSDIGDAFGALEPTLQLCRGQVCDSPTRVPCRRNCDLAPSNVDLQTWPRR